MFGHRPDGKRTKNIDPIVRITPYLMPMRCDAQVFLSHNLDYELMARYIARQASAGEKITFMQLMAAAYVRAVSQNPEANRFIFNKQYYSRNNCSISYAVLIDPQNHDSEEATVTVKFDLTDTIYDVRDRMNAAVEQCRNAKSDQFEVKLAKAVLAVPGLTTLIVGIARLLDRYGIPPWKLMKDLPFYCGMFITNNGSIGLDNVWHHIYNFGNVSMFLGMGCPRKLATVDAEGKARMKRVLPVGMTVDERVTSGAHYARFYAEFLRCLNHPELLEVPPESVRFDEGVEYHVPKIKQQA